MREDLKKKVSLYLLREQRKIMKALISVYQNSPKNSRKVPGKTSLSLPN
jgi:hypothetical protein